MRVMLLLLALAPLSPSLAAAQVKPVRLELGKPVERELAGDQVHRYRIPVRARQYLHVVVEQRGIDVVVTLLGPRGDELAEVDSPNGTLGPEPLSFIAEITGEYQLRVRSLEAGAAPGRYAARLDALREATAQDTQRWSAERAFARAERLVGVGFADSLGAAIEQYREALRFYRGSGERLREGAVLHGIGFGYDGLGRADSALAYYQRALTVRRQAGDTAGAGTSLNNIGVLKNLSGQADSALIYHHQSLAILQRLGDRVSQVSALNNIGLVQATTARPDSALFYYRQALALAREVGDREAESESLRSVGSVYLDVGQRDSALVFFHQALALSLAMGNRVEEGNLRNYIGYTHYFSGRPDSALLYCRQAVEIYREVGNRKHEGNALNNIGLAHDYLHHADSALAYFRESLEAARAWGDRATEAATIYNLGRAYQAAGPPDSALVYYQRGLAMDRALRKPSSEGLSLRALGGVYRQMGAYATAVAHFDSGAALLSSITAHAGGEANQVSYSEGLVGMYAGWALAWLAREPELGRGPSALAALAVAERGRAQALLALLRKTPNAAAPGQDLAAEGAGYLRAAARTGAAVLSYLVTPDTLVVWLAVPGRDIAVEQRRVQRDTLAALVGALRGALGAAPTTGQAMAARGAIGARAARTSLAAISRTLALLLLPAELRRGIPSLSELVIVPNGVLGLLPFTVLPLDQRGTALGTRFAVRYAPSLAVLGQVEERAGLAAGGLRSAALRTALVVGDPEMPVRTADGESLNLARLPGAASEAAWLGGQLGVQALTGGAATETAVRRRLPAAPVVHLATHGYAYATDAKARSSFIALAPDAAHDGLLTVGEVLDDPALMLRAELVVLSACETGLGDLKEAEGTLGLQRAFLAKGARSLLVSLWSVSDSATAILMRRFYTHWLQDSDRPSKAEGLRRAQEDLRKTRGFADPGYWAAFQLVGAR